MDERLEYPLPVLSVDTDALLIETKDFHEGRFRIKNTGGSTLSGQLLSRAACISFEPAAWEGNDVGITYRFKPEESGMKPGDVLETVAYICSNGGEKKLPVTIRLIKMAITTQGAGGEERIIANIRDFYDYARDYPAQARRLFTDSEFYMLLLATNYPYLEAYEMLHRDTNRERAMDNFFILSGLKQKTALTLQRDGQEFNRKPHENDILHSHFLARKSDGGFVEVPISAKNNAPWLNLPSHRLISADFNEANIAVVNFSINPYQIPGRYARETIMVGDHAFDVVYKRAAPLSMRLNREAYRFDDQGAIEINNNTGNEIWVEVFCKDSFIRFSAKKFPVGEQYQIPFTVKLSAFMSAQLLFRKLPFLKTVIEIKTVYRDQLIKRHLDLVVGKW
jgi:hypothetical protein